MNLEQQRINNPMMEFYRHAYHYSKRWNGKESLAGKHVIVYCEQGYGDIIQFLRYIKPLKEQGCEVTIAAPEALHALLADMNFNFFDKQSSLLPKHDYHVLSLSLPFLLGIESNLLPEPYIKYDKKTDLEEHSGGTKIGIAWEGSPEHPRNLDRCCPLRHFETLLEDDVKLFMLQNKIYSPQLLEGVNTNFPLYSSTINNFADTAALINAVDFVVTVDTSILHLAGAMGKKTYAILGTEPDPRWMVGNWYDSVTLFKCEWEMAFHIIKNCRKV